ncbi:MAG: threonine ammonia-lyase IlvA [Patescibacteria group bacterium]|nr:threonine ammonia-lyase IlvA [Patescibacteria group bacterium]
MKINDFIKKIEEAEQRIKNIIKKTPLIYCERLSKIYQSKIYFKREDLQEIRSFKIRGAFNKISKLNDQERKKGVVTASAGNHAQGVAYSCAKMKIKGKIFMPVNTPNQKIERVKYFGNEYVEIELIGQSFDESSFEAKKYSEKTGAIYVPAFDDEEIIAGQGTIGKEIHDDLNDVDYVLVPIGGGGLISGIGSYLKEKNKNIKILGIEPEGAASMSLSLKNKKIDPLKNVDTFCDGVAVKTVGKLTFDICQKIIDKIIIIPEGKVAVSIIDLFQNEGIITEPAGALSVAGLDNISEEIKGKKVVCVISGGNNDILRYPEILEKSLIYQGKKHYFLIDFFQKPGQLKFFLNNVLGPNDDIVVFEYIKKNNKEKGPALVGIELKDKKDLNLIIEKMEKFGFNYKIIKNTDLIYNYLI